MKSFFKSFVLALSVAALYAAPAHATYLGYDASFYTSYHFGFVYEGQWVKEVSARGYVLVRTHDFSHNVVKETKEGVQETKLEKSAAGFAGKGVLAGSGASGSGPEIEIVGAFVEYIVTLENGNTVTTPAFPVKLTQVFNKNSTLYQNDAMKLEMMKLVEKFTRARYTSETSAFEIEYLNL